LSEHARVEGPIRVAHFVSNGTVVGAVAVTESLEMQSKARIVGDVEYAMVEMHQGAVIEGRLLHRNSKTVELKGEDSN
jgi:cytoskeletal protein CcmA (bactofilin family)